MKRVFLAVISMIISLSVIPSCDILGDLLDQTEQEENDEQEGDEIGEGEGGENLKPDEEPQLMDVTDILPLSSEAQEFEFSFAVNVPWRIVIDENIDLMRVDV